MKSLRTLLFLICWLFEATAEPDTEEAKCNYDGSRSRRSATDFNDPGYTTQWFLERMNIVKAWKEGYTGKGVVISVVDEGLDKTHDEFKQRFDTQASYNFVDNSSDPKPQGFARSHGQKVAGLAAGEGNNNKCGVGVAYEANIGGLNFIDLTGTTATNTEKQRKRLALSHARNHVDIYACAWGPDDSMGSKVGYNEAHDVMAEGVKQGRNGKGSIYVFAAGNEGRFKDKCTYDGYTSSLYSFAVSVISPEGKVSTFSEFCPGISAVAFTRVSEMAFDDASVLMATATTENKCEDKFAATSAATGLAAGVFALTLQANRNLTWRDLHHIIARTANSDPAIAKDDDLPDIHKWKVNGGGRRVSNAFGFGVLDAVAMVNLAKNWISVREQKNCTYKYTGSKMPFSFNMEATENFDASECSIKKVEHVVLTMDLTVFPRRDLQVTVRSPQGTTSYMMIAGRIWDKMYKLVEMYPVKSLHHWDENPKGMWKVTFETVDAVSSGEVNFFELAIYGTGSDAPIVPTTNPVQLNTTATLIQPNTTIGGVANTTTGGNRTTHNPVVTPVTMAHTTTKTTTTSTTTKSSAAFFGATILVFCAMLAVHIVI